MRLLDRYIGRELLTTMLFAVAALSLVLVLGQIFKELFKFLIDHNIPATFILTFIGYFLPASLTFSIPWGFLTAVLLVFGRLSAGNELTALRTAGVSIPRIARPVLVLAVLCCGLCLWINLYVAPRAQQALKNAFFQVATSDPIAAFTGDQIITDFPDKKIYVGGKEGNQLKDIHVFELNKSNQPLRVVYARTGTLVVDSANRQIKMRLVQSRFEQRDYSKPDDYTKISDNITFGSFVFPISLEELYKKKQKKPRVETLNYNELRTELADLARNADREMVPKERAEFKKRQAATRTEFNKRFSFSLACFTLALIGIPLGITAHRQETSVGFGISIAVALAYFVIIEVVDIFREKGSVHPEILIWLPNAIFLLLGGYLFLRLARR